MNQVSENENTQTTVSKSKIKISPSIFSDIVGKLLTLLKKIITIELLNKAFDSTKITSNWIITAFIILTPIFGIIASIKLGGSGDVFLMSLGVSFALIVLQYISKGFVLALDKVIKNSSVTFTTDAFPNAIGLLTIISAIGLFILALFCMNDSLAGGFGMIIGSLVIFILGCTYMTSGIINININENNSPGEDAIGLISYIINGIAIIWPFIYVGVAISGMIFLTTAVINSNNFVTIICLGTGYTYLISAVLLPVYFYITYILYFLLIDILKAVLSIPRKLDALKEDKQ